MEPTGGIVRARWALFAAFVLGGLLSGVLAAAPATERFTAPLSHGMFSPLGFYLSLSDREPEQSIIAGKRRVNILVMGLDRRPVEDPSALSRTDSVMVLTLDTQRQTGGILSIPRDLLVPIPISPETLVHDRVNNIYAYGEQFGYLGGGPGLAKAMIAYNFGVPIDYYVLLDFHGFERMIDAIGGIDVRLSSPLLDPSYPTGNYGTMRVSIGAGLQHLNGERALWYARSRYQSSDFSRLERQRQVVMAARQKLLQLDMLPKLPGLWAIAQETVITDLTLSDVMDLAKLAWGISDEKITARSLDLDYVSHGMWQGDPFVLLPDRSKIGNVVRELFYDP